MPSSYHRAWREKNKERVAAAQERYRDKHSSQAVYLMKNHGISMAEAQKALATKPDHCEICVRTVKLYYDHDHSTSRHRGWLCNRCNVALGLVDQPDLLGEALLYLERHDSQRKLVLGG